MGLLPQWGLESQEALGDHRLLVTLGDQGGPSSQPVQRAPCLLAGLSNLVALDHPEFQDVLVDLGCLEHLSHRNGQESLGSPEAQDFPLCLWDLSDPEIQGCQAALQPPGILGNLSVLSCRVLLEDPSLQGTPGHQTQSLLAFLSGHPFQEAQVGPGVRKGRSPFHL